MLWTNLKESHFSDLTRDEFLSSLESEATKFRDDPDLSALFCVVSTHGHSNGVLTCKDTEVQVDKATGKKSFSLHTTVKEVVEKFESVGGKPKVRTVIDCYMLSGRETWTRIGYIFFILQVHSTDKIVK